MTSLVCIGNITHDQLLWMDTIPKLDDVAFVTNRRKSIGGRGAIVAATAATAGVPTALCTVVSPAGAERFLPMLRRAGVDVASLTIDAHGEGVFEVIVAIGAAEANCVSFFLPSRVEFRVDELHRSAVENADIVYVTTHKAAFNETLLQYVRPGKQTVIHNASSYLTRRPSYVDALLRTATGLIANAEECEFLLSQVGITEVRELFEKAEHLQTVYVTRGRNGVGVYSRQGGTVSLPAEPASVVTPVGAGDAFAAGIVVATHFKHDVESAARLGLRFAAISIASETSLPDLAEIAAASAAFNLGQT